MRASKPVFWAALGVVLALAACGGGDELPPAGLPAPEQQPAAGAATTGAPAAGAAQAQEDSVAAARRRETQLVREVFAYRGGGRDPFISLMQSGDVRPLIQDLRVTTINYNERYPSASVAILRDVSLEKRYTVRMGDELGRIRVAQIRRNEVILIVEEFGVEREEVLRMRRRQEGIP